MSPKFGEYLRTGIDIIDNQHREFLSRIDDLFVACQERRSREEMETILSFLQDYIRVHFDTEEAFMRESGYPALGEHRAEHRAFVTKVAAIQDTFHRDGSTETLSIAVNRLVESWFLDHINKHDVRMATYLKDHNTPS